SRKNGQDCERHCGCEFVLSNDFRNRCQLYRHTEGFDRYKSVGCRRLRFLSGIQQVSSNNRGLTSSFSISALILDFSRVPALPYPPPPAVLISITSPFWRTSVTFTGTLIF